MKMERLVAAEVKGMIGESRQARKIEWFNTLYCIWLSGLVNRGLFINTISKMLTGEEAFYIGHHFLLCNSEVSNFFFSLLRNKI